MNSLNLNKLITEALAIEKEEAITAGAIGYMARALIQATLPHSQIDGNEFKRHNGAFSLTILADSEIGLPYGSIPRLLISWITTEAVKTKGRELILGRTLSEFMLELDLIPSGGRWGSITRLKDQMKRLFSAAISCSYDDGKNWCVRNVAPIEQADLWWDPKEPTQSTLWESRLLLGHTFFNEIISNPIPIDMRALKALRQSPMALDIYCWLTYRMSYLRKRTSIPWVALQVQFGANYKERRQFKRRFLEQLKKVLLVYPEARIDEETENLILQPGRPHIQKEVKLFTGRKETPIKNEQEDKKESHKDQELRDKYLEYRLNTLVEIIENLQDQTEKHAILKGFDTYLSRKKLLNIRSQIIQGIHSREVKEELYSFVNNYWHHILNPIKSYSDFIKS
jgi:Plasmid encoded RepA protein